MRLAHLIHGQHLEGHGAVFSCRVQDQMGKLFIAHHAREAVAHSVRGDDGIVLDRDLESGDLAGARLLDQLVVSQHAHNGRRGEAKEGALGREVDGRRLCGSRRTGGDEGGGCCTKHGTAI